MALVLNGYEWNFMRARGQVYRFLTHWRGHTLTSGVLVDRRAYDVGVSPDELCSYAGLSNENPAACAHGKIAVLLNDAVHTYQAMPDGRVLPVFCGNSTAAAVVHVSQPDDRTFRIHGAAPEHRLVRAWVAGDTVGHSWTIPDAPIESRRWRGRNVLIMRMLNDYAILTGGLPPGVDPTTALHELFGPFGCPKLVVLEPGPEPLASFYNTNGRHGGAPQTGLASLAIAARLSDAVEGLRDSGKIVIERQRKRKTVELPHISSQTSGGWLVKMPRVRVSIAMALAEAAA